MKITEIKVANLEAPSARTLFDLVTMPGLRRERWIHKVTSQQPGIKQVMRVRTNEGIEGVCTATTISITRDTVDQLRHLVVGENPLDREKLYQSMLNASRNVCN